MKIRGGCRGNCHQGLGLPVARQGVWFCTSTLRADKLEQWRDRALTGIDSGLKERKNDPLEKALGEAKRRIGELVMEVEILQKERQAKRPLARRRSSR